MLALILLAILLITAIAAWYYFDVHRMRQAQRLCDMVLNASMRYYTDHLMEFDEYHEYHELPDIAVMVYSLKPIRADTYMKPESIEKLKAYFIE